MDNMAEKGESWYTLSNEAYSSAHQCLDTYPLGLW